MKLPTLLLLSISLLPLASNGDDIGAIIGTPKEKRTDDSAKIEKTEANGYVIYESKEEMFADLDLLTKEINDMSGGKYYALPKSIIYILQTQYELTGADIAEDSIEKQVGCSYSDFSRDIISILKPIIDLSLTDSEPQKIEIRNQIRDGMVSLGHDCNNDSVFMKKFPAFLNDFSSAMNVYAESNRKKKMQPEIDKEILHRATKAEPIAEKHRKNIATASVFAKCAAVYSAMGEFSATQKTAGNKQVEFLSGAFAGYAAISRIYSKYGYTIPAIQNERNIIKDRVMIMMRSDMKCLCR